MIRISLSDIDQVEQQLGMLKNQAKPVIIRALNRAAESVRTNVVKQAREEYYVKASDVRKTIVIYQATEDQKHPTILVRSRATMRELAAFKVSPAYPRPKNPPRVLKLAVKKEGGLKSYPGAFLAQGASTGAIHVMKRLGVSRYPVQIKYGPSVPEMIGSNLSKRQYRVAIETDVRRVYETRLLHEIDRVLGGDGK